ncbi:cytochrome c oxidase subunit 7A, mitochondrial-like [Periplaneta americana]|uniref:cytochrome c oxidase subunit 7A, mitochondrial-like n=1 Tax=Periplaneta americana TaxID=6978 RepID=UPI0037E704E3
MSFIKITRHLIQRCGGNNLCSASPVAKALPVACRGWVRKGDDFQVIRKLNTKGNTTIPTCGVSSTDVSRPYKKLALKQKRFQVDDGVPIFLKGGVFDKILYQITVVLCWVGIILSIKLFFNLSYSKLKENNE